MSGAPDGLGRFNIELLMRNKFCIGVKRGREYVCGGEADENVKGKAVELLSEAVKRMRRWHIWEAWWVVEWMDEWLEKRDRLETQLRGKYSEEVVNAITGLVDKFINYNEQFLNYWREVGNEVRKLIDDLMSGRAEVVIRGEDASGISVHEEHVTLGVDKASNDSVTVHLGLEGLEGVTIEVPDVFVKTMSREEYERFINDVLKALEGGLEVADSSVNKGRAVMRTTQTWQVIIWSLYPSENYVLIDAVDVNDGDLTIVWHLESHNPLKGILNNADKLGDEGLLAFIFGIVLGDGWVDIVKVPKNGRAYDEAVIEIVMSSEEFNAWKPILERLRKMGFRSSKPGMKNGGVYVRFYSSNAINLARAMINVLPPILRDVLDALAFEKWLNLRRIAEMEVKFRKGEMRVDVAGYKFTVDAHWSSVVLERRARYDAEVKKVISALRARYGDITINTHKSGRYRVVAIPMYAFERYDDIKTQVIEVLCRKLKKVKDERKRQIIIKHLKRLTAPTKGAAAAWTEANRGCK